MNDCLRNPRQAHPKYTTIVKEATDLVGIPFIPVVAADTDNACATKTYQGREVISYNEYFLYEIESMNYTAMEAVLFHEVGHQYYKHTNSQARSSSHSHERELQADYFAGFILRYRGANLYDGQSLYDHYLFVESPSHPHRSKRKEAMKNGWIAADKQICPEKYIVKTNPAEEFAKGMAVVAGVALLFGLIGAIAKGK